MFPKNSYIGRANGFFRKSITPTFVFLLIEFLDELIWAAGGAVLPSLRSEFSLTFPQIGLFFALPQVIGIFLEPAIMLLGDTRLRKPLIVAGGIGFALATGLVGVSWIFPVLLLAAVISQPTNAAFVSLSQASLIDMNHGRQSQQMARWNAAGSLGNFAGPILLSVGLAAGLGWRWLYITLAAASIALVLLVYRKPFPPAAAASVRLGSELKEVFHGAVEAVRNLRLLRWIALGELADLMLDIFTGFIALYFTEIAGFTPAQAGLLLSAYILVSLAADFLLIPLLEKIPGLRLIRATALAALIIYSLWLLVPWQPAKIALLLLIPFCRMGWYPVLSGLAYAELPGRASTAQAVGSLGGILNAALVGAVSLAAGRYGLQAALWLLLIGPLSLLIFTRLPGSPVGFGDRKSDG